MHISLNTNIDSTLASKTHTTNDSSKRLHQQEIESTVKVQTVEPVKPIENNEEIRGKVQEAVSKLNEMLRVNNNSSKFVYHEGLERYYVTVVDSETEEIVKEIPPKKLLDTFYEMQKMLGMIVDEKI